MQTKIWIEGDTIEAPCMDCGDWVAATYRYGTVRLEETGIDVPEVLVAMCNTCNAIVGIPDQSAPRLKAARERVEKRRVAVRITRELDDVLYMLADRFHVESESFISSLVRYYLSEIKRDSRFRKRVARLSNDRIATTGTKKQKTLRIQPGLLNDAEEQMRELGIQQTSDIVRGIIVAAKEDVLDHGAPSRESQLKQIAEAVI